MGGGYVHFCVKVQCLCSWDEAKSLNSGVFHPTLGFQDLRIQERMILLNASDPLLLRRISHLCVCARARWWG